MTEDGPGSSDTPQMGGHEYHPEASAGTAGDNVQDTPDTDADGGWMENALRYKAERDQARETNTRLHRRTQEAESRAIQTENDSAHHRVFAWVRELRRDLDQARADADEHRTAFRAEADRCIALVERVKRLEAERDEARGKAERAINALFRYARRAITAERERDAEKADRIQAEGDAVYMGNLLHGLIHEFLGEAGQVCGRAAGEETSQ